MKQSYINCRGRLLHLNKPLIAGILNVTPDSFYDGGRYTSHEAIQAQCRKIIEQGADIIDVGAASSRPGAQMPSEKEEIKRLLPALEIIRDMFPDVIISIDTYRYETAKEALQHFDIDIINDISAGEEDPRLPDLAAEHSLPYIIMHKQGRPDNMQINPHYNNITKELIYYFSEKLKQFRQRGIQDIIIDPGFGFGKTLEHNYELLANLERFEVLDMPIMVGLSRKSMIYKYLNIRPEDSLTATGILNKTALDKQADILRVHDVKEAKQTVDLHIKLSQYNKE
jgi:dihydropteroate synthase